MMIIIYMKNDGINPMKKHAKKRYKIYIFKIEVKKVKVFFLKELTGKWAGNKDDVETDDDCGCNCDGYCDDDC